MSKLFLRSLYLMLLTLCLPSMASAANVAKIGNTEYATLAEAVSAAQAGETVEITVAGDYTVPGISKNITIEGGVDGVVFNHTTAGNIASIPNGATFKNVTFNFGNVNYHGFQGPVGAVNMDNCTLNGKFFSYGDMNFTDCQFVQNNEDYHMWVYGKGTVTYTDCTFTNNVIGKFLNLYSESSENVGNVVVKNCKFINNGTKSKAAINVKATCGAKILEYTVDVENSTAEGAFPAASSSDALVVLNPLVQVDDRPATPTTTEHITITAENNTVTNGTGVVPVEDVAYTQGAVVEAAGVAQIGTTKYETLQAAIDAATTGATIDILADFDLTTIASLSNKYNVDVNKSITINGNNHTVTAASGKRAFVLSGSGNNIVINDLTVVNNGAATCMCIWDDLTCTLNNVTLDGTNYGETYNQPLMVYTDAGRATVNINNSTIKTNDAGSAHYAVILWTPTDLTITNSTIKGWANVYIKPDAEGSTVNISNSTLKSQGVAGASSSNNFSMFTTECGNNTITLTDNNISLTPAADTYMTLVTFNGKANNTVKVQGDQTTFTTTNVTRGGITHSKGDLENNTVSFDEDAHTAFAEAINVLKNEGVSDTEAEGVYTLGYVAEVYYYWIVSGAETGGNYDFAEPFKNGWLDNGEFIRLRKDVTLSENLTWAKENASFTLTLGEFSVTKGEFSVALKNGVTVNTDKQTDIFTAADAANYTITETEDNSTYTYTVTERPDVAQIGDVKYKSLAAAVAAVPTDGTQTTITMIADETTNTSGYVVTVAKNQNVVLDLNGKSVTGNTDSETTYALITNKGTLTIQDATGTGKLEVYPTKPWVYSEANPGGYASNLIRNEGTLTVENGNLYNDGKGSACYAIDNYTGGNVTINGGTVNTAKSSAVRLFYNDKDKNGNGGGSVTVNGGVIGHYNSDDDSSYMGIQVQKGTNANVTVSGGTIAGQYALYANNTGGSIEITDGTFDGYVGFAAAVPEESISISGGTFKEWVGAWGDQTGFISGGNFATDPTEYCAAGYIGKANGDNTYSVVTGAYVAQIGTTKYETLEEAIAAAQDGETVTLLADCAGNGIKVAQGKFATGLTVDFDGFTYTVDGETVGSTGTETNGFQLLKDNNITFKNGTITSEKAKILVQNYSNLTLEGMTLTLNNANYTSAYTLSNNNGEVVIDSTTINANLAGGFAFDVCRYASYPSVYVTVKDSSVINGDIEIFASKGDAKDGFGLTLTYGELNGNIVVDATAATAMDATPEKVAVTKDADFNVDAPAGYRWKIGDYNQYSLVIDEIVFTDGTDKYTISEDTNAPKVTYKRTFDASAAGVFKPWFVPFDYTITDEDVENFDFHSINKVEFAEGSTTKMQMRLSTAMQAGDKLTANTPYVYVPKKAGTFEFTSKNVTLKAESPETSRATYDVTGAVKVDFYGVYTIAAPAFDGDYIYYMAKAGTISRGTKTTSTVKAFRWIFRITENGQTGSAAYTFGFANDDDDITAVSSAAADSAESEVVGYYTLNGQKVSEPTKGVYVVKYANGTSKKVVF